MKALHLSLMLCATTLLCAQNSNPTPKIENVGDMMFSTFPDAPTCFTGAVEHGDLSNGPSTFLVKATKGCELPMNFHTPTEQVVMVSGAARMEMKGDQPRIMKAGAFAITPPRHPHRFTCTSACQFYVISDGAFDIHYVDDSGNEIPFEKAVKRATKTVGSQR